MKTQAYATPRAKTPTVLQMDAVECGAAALSMVLGYYKRFVPLETLRIDCGVSRDGSKASNLLKAAKLYGLQGKGFRKSAEELKHLAMPAIVFWNCNHFLVVEGFHKGRVYLNDPEVGPRAVTEQEFQRSFSGVVLLFKPGPEFEEGGVRKGLWSHIKPWLKDTGSRLTYLFLLSLVALVLALALPRFAGSTFASVLVEGHRHWFTWMVPAMLFTVLLLCGLLWQQQVHRLYLQVSRSLGHTSRLFWHMLRLPTPFYQQRHPGELSARVLKAPQSAEAIFGTLIQQLLLAIVALGCFVLMLRYSASLAAIALALLSLNLFFYRWFGNTRADLQRKRMQEQEKLLGEIMNGFQSIETLKATGASTEFLSRCKEHHTRLVLADIAIERFTLRLHISSWIVMCASGVLLLSLGAYRVLQHELPLQSLFSFLLLYAGFALFLRSMLQSTEKLQRAASEIERSNNIQEQEVEKLHPGADPTLELAGRLELRNITYGFSRVAPPLLKNLSLKLSPGSHVAIVGRTGSGKSTLARVIGGLYHPWEGEVLLGETPLSKISVESLRSSMAMVQQEVKLFSGSVRDNLTLWDSTLSEVQLIRAAKDACIHNVIAARQGGYDCFVEEEGRNFSGGQRQRLEIARALVRDPAILILDEATSSLDPLVEKEIIDNLRKRGCSCIIVAHRLSTIRDCNTILVMEGGRIVESGTHEELAQRGGLYSSLMQQEFH